MLKRIYYTILMGLSLLYANEESGYGWDVPNSSLNIGGYLDVTYDEKREDKLLFNDIAMLFSANQNRFDLLGEIELTHISLKGKSNNSSDIDLNLERLQLSYALSDKQTIQIGRFNSDIGYWNQAPIAILQDTTTKPHIREHMFPKATTGILYRQNIDEDNLFSLTFQDNKDIAHQDNTLEVERHFGFVYYGIKDEFSWRLSVGRYRDSSNITADYVGFGCEYDGEDFSLQNELFTQSPNHNIDKSYTGYSQLTWHFKASHDAVMRFESYKDTTLDSEEEIYLLGYAYRPTNNIAIKGEYIYHSELPLNRFVYSFSVLF